MLTKKEAMNRFAQLKEIENQFSLVGRKRNPFLSAKQEEGEFISPTFEYKISDIFSKNIVHPNGKVPSVRHSSGRPIDSFCKEDETSPRDAQMLHLCRRACLQTCRENERVEKMAREKGGRKVRRRRRLHAQEGRPMQTSSEGADTHCDHMSSVKKKKKKSIAR